VTLRKSKSRKIAGCEKSKSGKFVSHPLSKPIGVTTLLIQKLIASRSIGMRFAQFAIEKTD
jgi:hypothetical protein